jgi:hypothetical protein
VNSSIYRNGFLAAGTAHRCPGSNTIDQLPGIEIVSSLKASVA